MHGNTPKQQSKDDCEKILETSRGTKRKLGKSRKKLIEDIEEFGRRRWKMLNQIKIMVRDRKLRKK